MKQSDQRMRLIVKDKTFQNRIQKVMEEQELSHEQLLNKYLKLPHEGDLAGLNEKYELFTKFTKKHIMKSKDMNSVDLLMGHLWVIIANVIKNTYDADKISETILDKVGNGDWIKVGDMERIVRDMKDAFEQKL